RPVPSLTAPCRTGLTLRTLVARREAGVFSNLNWWEIAVLALIALFIFGPERLPKVISDGVRMIRTVRDMARNATSDLSRELGTDIQLEDLHPKTFIRKHLISEEDEAMLRRPFDDAVKEVKKVTADVNDTAKQFGTATSTPERGSTAGSAGAQPLPSGNGQSGYRSPGPFGQQRAESATGPAPSGTTPSGTTPSGTTPSGTVTPSGTPAQSGSPAAPVTPGQPVTPAQPSPT